METCPITRFIADCFETTDNLKPGTVKTQLEQLIVELAKRPTLDTLQAIERLLRVAVIRGLCVMEDIECLLCSLEEQLCNCYGTPALPAGGQENGG